MASGNRQAQIMRAVERLFTSRPAREITLDEVVREARVGKGTIYRYFQDKEDLLFRTATHGFQELHDLLTRRVSERAPFPRRLLVACRGVTAFQQRRRQLFRLMQSEQARMFWSRGEVRARWKQERKRMVAAMAGIVRKGVQEGCIRRDVPSGTLASLLLGMLWVFSRDAAEMGAIDHGLELVVEIFCRGSAPKSGRNGPARG
jgi:AcrR family transcriptional regulator